MWLLLYFGSKNVIKQSKKESMSEIDFSKEKEYYRDIINKHSISELTYLDDFKIDLRRDIIAMLLNLELKQKIKIAEGEIIVIDPDEKGLVKTEIFLLQNIKDGKVQIKFDNLDDIENLTKKELLEKELISENPNKTINFNNMKIRMVVRIIIAIICILVILNIVSTANKIVLIFCILCFFTSAVYVVYFPIWLFLYYLANDSSYIRTEKGEEINRKIEGLKKYMSDYSLIKDKTQKELALWDEYLVYSVIFNLNNKVVDQMSNLVDIEFVKYTPKRY